METSKIKNEWLNPLGVEKEYSISKSTLAKWRMSNKYLPYSKVGKYIKYKRSDIESFLNNNIVEVA
ncbi:helix-turn-helix domain-containing protein [Aliarcobacter butzleri]